VCLREMCSDEIIDGLLHSDLNRLLIPKTPEREALRPSARLGYGFKGGLDVVGG